MMTKVWPGELKTSFEDILRSSKSKDTQYNGQQKNDKRKDNNLQKVTQKTKRLSNTNPTKSGRGGIWVLRKGKEFLLHMWYPSCKIYIGILLYI